MELLSIYIQDFICFKETSIDFSEFNSAIIVGQKDGNNNYSNGTGKTTLFRSLEYVLFGRCRDINLEELIRDETDKCRVILTFSEDNKIYRIQRSRNRKGLADLSLFERNCIVPSNNIDPMGFNLKKEDFNTYWDNKTGRRSQDTEKELYKIIKINYDSFINTQYFVQNDLNGIASATPTERKKILKDVFRLFIFSKLEKNAKDKLNLKVKELDINKITLSSFGNPLKDIEELDNKLLEIDEKINTAKNNSEKYNALLIDLKSKLNDFTFQYNDISEKLTSSIKEKSLLKNDITKLNVLFSDFINKRAALLEQSKNISTQISFFNSERKQIDISNIDIDQLSKDKINIETRLQNNIAVSIAKKNELNGLLIPLPEDIYCNQCRQAISEEHRDRCKKDIDQKIVILKEELKNLKIQEADLQKIKNDITININNYSQNINKIKELDIKILSSNNELKDKKSIYQEYSIFIENTSKEIKEKEEKLKIFNDISSDDDRLKLQNKITNIKTQIVDLAIKAEKYSNEFIIITNNKAIIEHAINEKKNILVKQKEILGIISVIENDISMHQLVIQAFGTLPNLLIQDILAEYQDEANALLAQLKPGLQLEFIIEKVKSDGSLDETLDIKYYVNGKTRSYGLLSGAMKIMVIFSLKIGLAFLLQKKTGAMMRVLMLDEADQGLDKASKDAYVEIIHRFQKDFTIMVITHNDALNDKFNNRILVEQDKDMVSRATLISG